ncbi:MAG: phenylacetate--CoA ligase [Desulfovibrionaceae bacterium]|nr:phenylacetate--CoA ligase [Desulfovibrionaceae bacterium]
MSIYYNPIIETMPRAELEALQVRKLRELIAHLQNSRFYAEQFKEMGLGPESVKTLADLRKFKFTTKKHLRAAYPYGMLAVPKDDCVRLHASSGTTGVATVILHTQGDIDHWADLMARSLYAAGVRRSDILQNTSGYGMFTGGLGIHYGSERLGCLTVPAGAGNTERQIKFMFDFGVTVAHIIPSYALYLASYLEKHGIDPKTLPLRIAVIGAEPHTEETRRKVEKFLDVKAYNSYGLSEMNGPGVAFECVHQAGMHIWEDAYIAEIIDPETGEPLPDGEVGELVLTTLDRRGMPLLRYRTRDLTRFIPGECACGRTHRRLDRMLGRADDMLIIKGVNVYPMQIEQVLMGIEEVGENYVIEIYNDGIMDDLRIKVEVASKHFVEDMRALRSLQQLITTRLKNEILFTPKVELVEHNSLPVSEGKAKRVVDLR